MGRLSDLLRKRHGKDDPKPHQGEGIFPSAPPLDIQYDGVGNLLVGRRRYAVGLEWEPVRPDEPLRAQADRIQRTGYRRNLHARLGGQVGFASSDRQHRRGALALVTSARSGSLGPRWVGAFQINEADRFWWVASIRDGEVYEDAILSDEASARSLLLEALDAPDWTRIVAPSDWQVAGAIEGRIEQVFDLRSGVPLRPVDGRRDMVQRVIILSMIGLTCGGMYLYWSDMQRKEAERAEELRRMRDSVVRVDPRSYPWADAVPILSFVDVCAQEIERSLFVVTGWTNEPIVCAADGFRGEVSTGWVRTGGRLPWLRAATSGIAETVRLTDGGARARIDRPFGFPEHEIVDIEPPWTEMEVAEVVLSRFQTLGLSVNLRPRVRNLTTTQRHEIRAPVYNRHDLTLETSVAIREYARLLSDVPALVPEALIYSVESGSWTLTAKIHHPPILPLPPR